MARARNDESVGEMFDRCTHAPVVLPDDGKWWITRKRLGVEDGKVTIDVADGDHMLTVTGSPNMLRRLAEAIAGQVDGAEVNTANVEATPLQMGECLRCSAEVPFTADGRPVKHGTLGGYGDCPGPAEFVGTGPDWTPGERVRLVTTNDKHTRLKAGATGTVTGYRHHPEDGRVVAMRWDDGSTLTMLLDEGDQIERIR